MNFTLVDYQETFWGIMSNRKMQKGNLMKITDNVIF